jgi:phospholipid transport system substrate-binding protein
MARSALAIYWAKRTPAEKKEFVSLFADLIKDTYIKKIEMYSGEKVLYAGESVNNGYAVVKTRIASKTGNEIPIDYMMLDENGTWMIYDVLIEGVSLVNNYKAQFAEIINSGSYEELVRKLKNKELTKSK